MKFWYSNLLHMCESLINTHDDISCRARGLRLLSNGVDRPLKKLCTSKGDYCIKQCHDSLQLHPFSKWELLLKERSCSQREQILSLKSSSLSYGKPLLPH